jgi:RecQ family ATP-dependent DNA helicase
MNNKRLEEYNSILNKYFGYSSLKEEQYNIISNAIDGRDIFAILATGFGKSICYQLPTLITKKCVIVISPLIALMQEQSQEMKNRNIPVCVFNSSKKEKEKEDIKYKLLNGENRLIYMTPEYLIKSENFIKQLVKSKNLSIICIDESHAVSTWGLDFRSSYTKLNVIREWIPEIPILTLTATASVKVKEDVIKILKLENPLEITGNFDRPNLTIKVYPQTENIMENISSLLNKYKNEYKIIYCKTREETETLSEKINKLGIKCESYHAGIAENKRSEIQQDFIDGKYKCIIATIAFGMGINIKNVRLVIHYNCPKNIESYYQEIGRAGRDNKPSECVLFYSKKDFYVNRIFLKSIEDDKQREYQENQIRLIEKYVYSNECRRKLILINFGQKMESCTNCDNCLKKLDKNENKNENLADYTKETYLFLNLINKLNDKFGSGMIVNILTGKSSKVKEYMCNYDEFGSGISFGNEKWWKEFVRILINNDLLIETQIKGGYGSTLSITNKGRILRNKLTSKYSSYADLVEASINNDEDYDEIKLLYDAIINVKSLKTKTPRKNKKEIKKEVKKEVKVKINNNYNEYIDKFPTTFTKYNKTDTYMEELEKELMELSEKEKINNKN